VLQSVPLKAGPLARRNKASGPALSGTFCISLEEWLSTFELP
jgi:hypothetical protein